MRYIGQQAERFRTSTPYTNMLGKVCLTLSKLPFSHQHKPSRHSSTARTVHIGALAAHAHASRRGSGGQGQDATRVAHRRNRVDEIRACRACALVRSLLRQVSRKNERVFRQVPHTAQTERNKSRRTTHHHQSQCWKSAARPEYPAASALLTGCVDFCCGERARLRALPVSRPSRN